MMMSLIEDAGEGSFRRRKFRIDIRKHFETTPIGDAFCCHESRCIVGTLGIAFSDMDMLGELTPSSSRSGLVVVTQENHRRLQAFFAET